MEADASLPIRQALLAEWINLLSSLLLALRVRALPATALYPGSNATHVALSLAQAIAMGRPNASKQGASGFAHNRLFERIEEDFYTFFDLPELANNLPGERFQASLF